MVEGASLITVEDVVCRLVEEDVVLSAPTALKERALRALCAAGVIAKARLTSVATWRYMPRRHRLKSFIPILSLWRLI